MAYKGYGNRVELSVFEKDPDTQGTLTLPPLLRKDVYVHHAVDIVFSRDSNLGSTRGWSHRGTCVSRVYTRVYLLGGLRKTSCPHYNILVKTKHNDRPTRTSIVTCDGDAF